MTAPTEQPQGARPSGIDPGRVAIGGGAAILVLAVAALAFGASRLTAPGVPEARYHQDTGWQGSGPGLGPHDARGDKGRELRGARDFRDRLRDLRRQGQGARLLGLRHVTISAIDGSNVTLATEDGWTRTITVTDATTLTRAGATITLADLKVGDEVRFRQTRNDDGSYTVTAIAVILPSVAGQVTATTGDTITVQLRNGMTATVHVGSSTTYRVRGIASATLSDISVGMLIVAQGTENPDSSLEAVAVYAAAKR